MAATPPHHARKRRLCPTAAAVVLAFAPPVRCEAAAGFCASSVRQEGSRRQVPIVCFQEQRGASAGRGRHDEWRSSPRSIPDADWRWVAGLLGHWVAGLLGCWVAGSLELAQLELLSWGEETPGVFNVRVAEDRAGAWGRACALRCGVLGCWLGCWVEEDASAGR